MSKVRYVLCLLSLSSLLVSCGQNASGSAVLTKEKAVAVTAKIQRVISSFVTNPDAQGRVSAKLLTGNLEKSCAKGGNAKIAFSSTEGDSSAAAFEIIFEQCAEDDFTINGNLSYKLVVDSNSAEEDGVSLGGSVIVEMKGTVTYVDGSGSYSFEQDVKISLSSDGKCSVQGSITSGSNVISLDAEVCGS